VTMAADEVATGARLAISFAAIGLGDARDRVALDELSLLPGRVVERGGGGTRVPAHRFVAKHNLSRHSVAGDDEPSGNRPARSTDKDKALDRESIPLRSSSAAASRVGPSPAAAGASSAVHSRRRDRLPAVAFVLVEPAAKPHAALCARRAAREDVPNGRIGVARTVEVSRMAAAVASWCSAMASEQKTSGGPG
jgi:hypothetical protein